MRTNNKTNKTHIDDLWTTYYILANLWYLMRLLSFQTQIQTAKQPKQCILIQCKSNHTTTHLLVHTAAIKSYKQRIWGYLACVWCFMTEKILTCSICWQLTDVPICKLIMVVITVRSWCTVRRVAWCGYLNCWFQHCLVIFRIVKRQPFKHHLASNASICDGGCSIGSLMSNELVGFHPRSKPEKNDEWDSSIASNEVLESNHQVDNKDYSQPWYKDPY